MFTTAVQQWNDPENSEENFAFYSLVIMVARNTWKE